MDLSDLVSGLIKMASKGGARQASSSSSRSSSSSYHDDQEVKMMAKSRLQAQISRYKMEVERQRREAEKFYAKYKESNSPDDYKQSQYYYREAEKSQHILDKYEEAMRTGQYIND